MDFEKISDILQSLKSNVEDYEARNITLQMYTEVWRELNSEFPLPVPTSGICYNTSTEELCRYETTTMHVVVYRPKEDGSISVVKYANDLLENFYRYHIFVHERRKKIISEI